MSTYYVPRSKVLAFLRDVGLDPAEVKSVTFGTQDVKVVRFLRNGDGKRYLVDGEPATETVECTMERDA